MVNPHVIAALLVLIFFFGASPSLAQEEAALGLDRLVAEALASNPELRAAEERWRMFEHKQVPAGTLADPRLSLAFSNYPADSLDGDEFPMTGNEVRIDQAFPFPGKLEAKADAARQQAVWYQGVYEDARLQLAMKVRDAWYRLYFQDRAIAITERNMELLDDFIRLTETRYEVGTGLQQDVLKAQVERSRLMDRLFTLRQERVSALAEFNRLLARPAGAPLELPRVISLEPLNVDAEELRQMALEHRPMFASYRALVDQYQAQKELARLDYYPDVGLFASYRFRDDGLPDGGTDFASAGVSLNLPLWREKRAEQVAEAEAGLRMARRQLADFRDQVFARIEDARSRLDKNRTLIELFEDGLLPQARQAFEASLAAYRVGDVDFLSLLDSLMALYRYEIDHQRAISEYQRSVAGLRSAVGLQEPEPSSNED